MGKNKVLYLLDDPSKDIHLHKYLLEGMIDEDFLPTIGYFYGESCESKIANEKIKAVGFGLKKDEFKGINLRVVNRLREYILQEDFQIIHTQRYRPLIHAALALLGIKDKQLFHTVGDTNTLRSYRRRLLVMLLNKKIKRIICVSRGVLKYLSKSLPLMSSKKMTVIHNGVNLSQFSVKIDKKDARSFLDLPGDGFYFGIVARLKKAKCHASLLYAFKKVIVQFPDTRLAIVGGGPLYSDLIDLSDELGILGKVFFTGQINHNHVPIVLKAFNCFVHPSMREGLGVSVIEAMAFGLPVIISDADGLHDIFFPKKNELKKDIGRMVKTGDIYALSRAMLEFRMMEEKKLREIGENARKHAETYFSKEMMVEKTLKLYSGFSERGRTV